MKAILFLEHRFRRDAAGNIFSSSNSVNTLLWERYLKQFDTLTVVARVEPVTINISKEYLVTLPDVHFIALPYYVGPIQFVKKYIQIRKIVNDIVKIKGIFICRLPSIIGGMVIGELKKNKTPYVVELVGDPWEVFAPGSIKVSFSFIHRYRSSFALKRMVKGASGVIYVTKRTLQRRYPASSNAISTHASNVILRKQRISPVPKKYSKDPKKDEIYLLAIGSLAQLYKSPDVVVEAISILRNNGLNVRLTWLGDGIFKDEMILLSKHLGVFDFIDFIGNVSTISVEEYLSNTDLFIHVSRTEGLPRAIIEAMASGLPCIGSKVGGIPELLSSEVIISDITPELLAEMITKLLCSETLMNSLARENLGNAYDYELNTLNERRSLVYNSVKNLVLKGQ